LSSPGDVHCTWAPGEEEIAREGGHFAYRYGSIESLAIALCAISQKLWQSAGVLKGTLFPLEFDSGKPTAKETESP